MEHMIPVVCCIFIQLFLFPPTDSYKHVIFMHGLLGNHNEFDKLTKYIDQNHPGTTYTLIKQYEDRESLTTLWTQTEKIKATMSTVMRQHPDGVHLLCYSQGGLVCRGVLESLPDHNVQSFISLSSPQGGQYGLTDDIKIIFSKWVKKNIYRFFYTKEGQLVSVANYWNDPHHQDKYLKYSAFLAVLNNQSSDAYQRSHEFKANFVKVKDLVLIGGPDDGVITPWQSSQFAAYDKNENVVEMKQQEWYSSDWFGLQTLDKRGALHNCTLSGYTHKMWPRNYTVFQRCIEPWLT